MSSDDPTKELPCGKDENGQEQEIRKSTDKSQVQPEYLDFTLQYLVFLVNTTRFSFPITIQAGGIIISGLLVNREEYFNHLATTFHSYFHPANEEIANRLTSIMKRWGEPEDPSEITENTLLKTHYIHLKNARIIHNVGPSIPAEQGVWWRGRLDTISGFMLGEVVYRSENE